jgi:formylglycine-generating enzyme required for sulfatase activity
MKNNHKNILLALLLILAAPGITAAASNPRGDINGDGYVNVADVTVLISHILGNNPTVDDTQVDVNRDGQVNVADVTTLISYILGNITFPPEPEEFTVNEVTFVMMPVEGGTFTMGATAEQGNEASERELPTHQVTLSSYSIGQTEVTQELWESVMGYNPSYFKGPQLPVENVSWEDCQLFIAALNEITGREFHLPTEAQWEFAARGGNPGKDNHYLYAGGNDIYDVAWYNENSMEKTHPVGGRAPNELGLYDMSGNVWELCNDWYGGQYYRESPAKDPIGPPFGSTHVCRGGCWFNRIRYCRVSSRGCNTQSSSNNGLGLRLAL